MINLSAYDTTACAGWQMKSVVDHVARAHVSAAGTVKVTTGQHSQPVPMILIQGGSSFTDDVPFFRHPLPVKNLMGDNELILAVDVRDFGKWVPAQQLFHVRNTIEYAWTLRRAVINQLWIDGRPEALRDLSPLPGAIYAALASECIGRMFSLNPAEQMVVAVLAAYFYYGLFTNENDFGETEKPALLGKIAQMTRVPAQRVFDLLDKRPVMHSLSDLVEAIKIEVNNVALESLVLGTYMQALAGVWFGTNSRENMLVGLEHIPTWFAIIAAAFESAVYKRSPLAKLAQRLDKGGASTSFSRSLEALMGGPRAVCHAESGEPDAVYDAFFH